MMRGEKVRGIAPFVRLGRQNPKRSQLIKRGNAMEIIGQIYEALDDDEAFAALAGTVAREVGARSATFMTHAPDHSLEDIFTHYFSAEMTEYYAEHQLDRLDSWWNTVAEVTRGLNYTVRTGDFQTPRDFENTYFCREFIRSFGDDSTFCMGFRANRSDDGLVTLGLHKPKAAGDFSDDQVKLLEALRPHITRMAMLRRKLIRQAKVASGALQGINQIEDAYLVLKADRRITFANSAAELLLKDPSLLQAAEGKLYLYRSNDDYKLAQALKDADVNRLSSQLAFLARDKSGTPWRFLLAPKSFNHETMILVWIDKCKPGDSAPEAIQQIYGLTNAELPILQALSEGLTAAKISDRQQISIATVRSHVSHIYQKTGVNKASQLASLVASLPKAR